MGQTESSTLAYTFWQRSSPTLLPQRIHILHNMRASFVALTALFAVVSANPVTKRGDVHCGTTGTYESLRRYAPKLTFSRRHIQRLSSPRGPRHLERRVSGCSSQFLCYTLLRSRRYNENNVCHFTNVLANVYDYPALK